MTAIINCTIILRDHFIPDGIVITDGDKIVDFGEARRVAIPEGCEIIDAEGLYERKSDDWVFIDWSTFDSNGPICAEQMLLARAYESFAKCAAVLGDT